MLARYLVPILIGFAGICQAQVTDNPFVAVFIDSASERKLGSHPIDRAYLAQAITIINAAQPKGIVLKLFLDQGKKAESDNKLAKAMGKATVVLQASINDQERSLNLLPSRFYLSDLRGLIKTTAEGNNGVIPHRIFSAQASDIGFIDSPSVERIPMLERLRGAPVKSLWLASLELATGQKADIEIGKQIKFGTRALDMDNKNQVAIAFPKPGKLDYIPLHDILDGKIDSSLLKNKVVIIGYDGNKSPTIRSKYGAIKLHRAFYYTLSGLYTQLK